jgi:hypothetical protein
MAGGFDDFREQLRDQLLRCADEATAAERSRTSAARPAVAPRAARRRSLQWPEPRRALAWAAVLTVGVAALAAGLLMVGSDDRQGASVSSSGLVATPGRPMPAYVASVAPRVSPSPSSVPSQSAARPGYSLTSVSALSGADVWAVGAHGDAGVSGALAGLQDHSFIVHYDGTAWRETSTPDVGALTAVAAAADGQVWTLGPSGAILHWDGWKWTIAESAAQDGDAVLRGLAAVSPTDVWAVGSEQGAPFAVHWDGASWQTAALPTPAVAGGLNAISGSATDLWAVGAAADGTRVLTAHWDGTRWSYVPDAGVSDGGLLTVATVAPNDVWAGGDALLQHWDGTQWRDVSQSFSGVRGSLSAVSSSDVWLGAAGGMAHWNGATWRPVTTQQMDLTGHTNAQIGAVSALSPTDVWAAGTLGSGSATSAPLVVHYDGSGWSVAVDSVQNQ